MPRIGLLTSGGDCQALNATMRGIVKTILNNCHEPVELYVSKTAIKASSMVAIAR